MSLCLSFLSLRRPPTPPLFPYATLFRSPPRVVDPGVKIALGKLPGGNSHIVDRFGLLHGSRRRGHKTDQQNRDGQDRKSTRLNSSHVSISYAVFCLKKKKQTTLC